MSQQIDISSEHRQQLQELLDQYLPGVQVWAYGSRVTLTANPGSDLDLVAFSSPGQASRVSDLREALDESSLPFAVDLHVWDDVPERFRRIILEQFVVLKVEGQPPGTSTDTATG